MTRKWERIGVDVPTNKWVYNVKYMEVAWWVEKHPNHMWKFYDVPLEADVSISTITGQNYIFTDEMESWFMLRWAGE